MPTEGSTAIASPIEVPIELTKAKINKINDV